ncbi:MAG: hypothetical protein ACI8PP_001557 [Candidatus Pseudothioglobus sp.]
MEETSWWSKLALVSSILAVVLLFASPLGYKYGVAPLMPSFASLLLALAIAVLVLVGGVIMAVIAQRGGMQPDRNVLLIAIVISLVPLLAMGPTMIKARSVPAIHDISTDTQNPPTFDVVVGLRADAPNSLEYGAGLESAAALASMQLQAYPQIKTRAASLAPSEAVARVAAVLTAQGMEVVNENVDDGRVEAVFTSFWFGFKDDIVVRVKPTEMGSAIDIRSVSRVGISDIGANAARIERILTAL